MLVFNGLLWKFYCLSLHPYGYRIRSKYSGENLSLDQWDQRIIENRWSAQNLQSNGNITRTWGQGMQRSVEKQKVSIERCMGLIQFVFIYERLSITKTFLFDVEYLRTKIRHHK